MATHTGYEEEAAPLRGAAFGGADGSSSEMPFGATGDGREAFVGLEESEFLQADEDSDDGLATEPLDTWFERLSDKHYGRAARRQIGGREVDPYFVDGSHPDGLAALLKRRPQEASEEAEESREECADRLPEVAKDKNPLSFHPASRSTMDTANDGNFDQLQLSMRSSMWRHSSHNDATIKGASMFRSLDGPQSTPNLILTEDHEVADAPHSSTGSSSNEGAADGGGNSSAESNSITAMRLARRQFLSG